MSLENDIIQHVQSCGEILAELQFGEMISLTANEFNDLRKQNLVLIDQINQLIVDSKLSFRVEEQKNILKELQYYKNTLFSNELIDAPKLRSRL